MLTLFGLSSVSDTMSDGLRERWGAMRISRFLSLSSAFVALTLAWFVAAGGALAASSDCPASIFSGHWENVDENSKLLVRLRIADKCERVVPKSKNGNSPWAGMLKPAKPYIYHIYTLRPFGRCSPADCVWGRSKGKLDENGVLKARFRMFWSERFLEVTPFEGKLRVRWRIQYIGRKKPDQLGDVLMRRAD